MKHQVLIFTVILLLGASFALPAMAQPGTTPPSTDLIPPASTSAVIAPNSSDLDGETHPPLKLTPDKSELVRLDRDAASVVVGNPAQVAVMLDTPRLAVVIPRSSGATYFTVLDKDGNVIMQRHVLVDAPKKNYVRVRRSCANTTEGRDCQATSVYFCPDMCHEVGAASADGADGSAGSSATAQ